MKLRAGLITAALATITLISGCGTHPGSAAVVDDAKISMGKVDASATAYCKLSLAQGAEPASTIDARREALADLIAWTVVTNLADKEGLDLDSAHWDIDKTEHEQIAKTFDAADVPAIEKVLRRSHHTLTIQTALGEQQPGVDSEEQAQEAGQQILLKTLDEADLSIDPRFGLSDELEQISATGSLSVPKAGEQENAEQLAQTNQCS